MQVSFFLQKTALSLSPRLLGAEAVGKWKAAAWLQQQQEQQQRLVAPVGCFRQLLPLLYCLSVKLQASRRISKERALNRQQRSPKYAAVVIFSFRAVGRKKLLTYHFREGALISLCFALLFAIDR
jgi:hypothetical protein